MDGVFTHPSRRQGSVGHGDQWAMNLQGLGELVEHLLIVIKCPELDTIRKTRKEKKILRSYMGHIPVRWVPKTLQEKIRHLLWIGGCVICTGEGV